MAAVTASITGQLRRAVRVGDSVRGRLRAPLQRVFARRVVVQAVGETPDAGGQQIGLGRVQVAARRVGAQRPAVGAVLLPGGQREAQLEQRRDAVAVRRARRHAGVQVGPGRGQRAGHQRQQRDRRTGPAAEGVRLRVPVQRFGARGVALQMVLAALVIGPRRVQRVVHDAQTGRFS
ncbi:MAG: hypothetical protein ACSLE9_07075 [Burkholderiaceae bacterium]